MNPIEYLSEDKIKDYNNISKIVKGNPDKIKILEDIYENIKKKNLIESQLINLLYNEENEKEKLKQQLNEINQSIDKLNSNFCSIEDIKLKNTYETFRKYKNEYNPRVLSENCTKDGKTYAQLATENFELLYQSLGIEKDKIPEYILNRDGEFTGFLVESVGEKIVAYNKKNIDKIIKKQTDSIRDRNDTLIDNNQVSNSEVKSADHLEEEYTGNPRRNLINEFNATYD